MGTKSISLIVAVAVLVLASGPAVASGERVAASIESSLKVMDYNRAGSLYEDGKTWIHESLDASLRVATAYVEFAGKPEVLRYQSIPEECVSVAMECLEACDSMLEDDADDQARLKVARQYHIGAAIYIKAGVGDKGENAEKAALEHVEALAKLEIPPRGTHLLLGEIKLAMCKADPRKARTLIADARTAFDKAREIQGDSPALARCSAETVVKLAEVIELENEGKKVDRKVTKELCGLYQTALATYKKGLKLKKDDKALKSGFNACVWRVMALNKGKCREKPILRELSSRYRALKVKVPDSDDWIVTPNSEIGDKDDVLKLYKVDRKAKQSYIVWVSRYGWDTAYTDPETGSSIGGDNIKGLAKDSYQSVRSMYADIKNERPLHKAPLSRRIKKAYMYRMEGRSKDNDLFEIRAYYFKHSKMQKTYCILIFANMGMLKENPYELEIFLKSFEMVNLKKKRR